MLFFDEPGGSEKSFVTTAIQQVSKCRGVRVLAVASSAVAAQLLDNRSTAHSALKIPIQDYSQSTCSIETISKLLEELRRTSLIVLDGIVITHRHNLKAVDRTLKNLLRSVFPFGGIVVLCIG